MVLLTQFRPLKSRANYLSLPSQVQRYSKPSPTYLFSPSAWVRCGIAETRARLLDSEEKRDIIRDSAKRDSARPDSARSVATHSDSQEKNRDERHHSAVRFPGRVAGWSRTGHFRTRSYETCNHL